MSHEFTLMILIAAALLLIAAVCGVLFWGVVQGKTIADDGFSAISDTINGTDILTSLEQHNTMPAAACYNILKEHSELIVGLDCHICGAATVGFEVGDCLKNHMYGRVKLTLTEEESGGTYIAEITGG